MEKSPGALLRVISLFHRLTADVEGLIFRSGENAAIFSMTIVLQIDPDMAPRIEAHLLKIVAVMTVEVK